MTDPKKLCDELEFRMKRGSITATDGLLYDIVTALRVGSPPAPDNAALVEELAKVLWDTQYPAGTSWDDWAEHHTKNKSKFDGRDHSRELARAILPIITREREQAWQAELRGAKLVEELADIIETLVVAYGPNASPSRADTAHAIIPIITRECDAAAKAALEAAAKCASDYLNGATFDSRDCGIICPERIRALDPAQFRKDR